MDVTNHVQGSKGRHRSLAVHRSFGNKKMVDHGEILLLIDIGGSDSELKTEDDDNFAQNLEELLH